ncbi:acetyltransferase (GNAT) family protein [Novosphingobium sp. PhB165]|uniref:GNAT family N-acetyltransferase n=1 Tax=Novosphingobium sp. PhB165 TaxID=2485105 RepID=UPI0010533497|nr:GNAT family N-acetyltransferase [Novosphingobium sp. PhB165]TCM19896.1 acetyltransferase (GNAT) family protein [Novosphingobium sp. PhB165]
MRWREMREEDVAAVAEVAEAVHLDYPENPAVFAACFRLYPSGCHVLEDEQGRVAGYLVSHPGRQDRPPVLNHPMTALAEPFDCYFLHDLALGAATRGRGLAGSAVRIVLDEARARGLDRVVLIAVGDAHGFWEKQGFGLVGDGLLDPAKGYGPEARMLARAI